MLKEKYYKLLSVDSIILNPTKGYRKDNLKRLGYDENINLTKNKIANIKIQRWVKIRKLVNNYEFPFVDGYIKKPVSRAFFKILEIMEDHSIDLNCNTLHLAEAPGGFIEACIHRKTKKEIKNTKHYTFSILGDKKIPIYNINIVKHPDVFILSNKANTGNLYDIENVKFLINTLYKKDIKFITCDGGFAENSDFEAKEELHHKLIFHEIITSIFILSNGGCLLIKVFDMFTELTFDFLYLLSYLFSEVHVCKPHTSRPTNSEKYILCKGFIKSKLDIKLQSALKSIIVKGIDNFKTFVHKGSVKELYVSRVKHINKVLSDYQIYNINNIIEIDKLNLIVEKNDNVIHEWCRKYY